MREKMPVIRLNVIFGPGRPANGIVGQLWVGGYPSMQDTLVERTQNYDSLKWQQTDQLWSPNPRSDGILKMRITFLINDQGDTLAERTQYFDYSTNQVKAFPDKYLWVDTQQMQVASDAHYLMVVQKADGD